MKSGVHTVILKARPGTEVCIVECDRRDVAPPDILRAAFNKTGEVEILLPDSPVGWAILADGYRVESIAPAPALLSARSFPSDTPARRTRGGRRPVEPGNP